MLNDPEYIKKERAKINKLIDDILKDGSMTAEERVKLHLEEIKLKPARCTRKSVKG
jgi:polyhydroxyalkanoate synthesis regulator phasin